MLSKSAQTILQRRYLQRDEDGEVIETIKKAIGHKVDTLEPAVQEEDSTTVPCPECGKPILHAEGCVMCPSCGFSKCN